MLPSAHRGPGAVRIAASVAASDLRLAVDIDGVRIRPALQSVGLIAADVEGRRSVQEACKSLEILVAQQSITGTIKQEKAGRTCP
jgi:hypothetical protein